MTRDHKLLHQLEIPDGQVVQVRLGAASVATSSVSAPSPGPSKLPEVSGRAAACICLAWVDVWNLCLFDLID